MTQCACTFPLTVQTHQYTPFWKHTRAELNLTSVVTSRLRFKDISSCCNRPVRPAQGKASRPTAPPSTPTIKGQQKGGGGGEGWGNGTDAHTCMCVCLKYMQLWMCLCICKRERERETVSEREYVHISMFMHVHVSIYILCFSFDSLNRSTVLFYGSRTWPSCCWESAWKQGCNQMSCAQAIK